jgi:TetR/AcrR family transcriptional repressor of nem operon
LEFIGNFEKGKVSMRYKPEQKQQTAANILAAAEREFRLGGYGGVGVDGLAQEAGVTSGAFYKHFRSKAAVFEAAVNAGMQRYLTNIEQSQQTFDDNWLKALADYYLGREHRKDIAEGCVVTGLSSEVIRSSEQVRSDYQAGIEKVADKIGSGLTGHDEEEHRRRAWVILAMLAGGVLLSRAVHDDTVADEIASAVHEATLDFK